MTPTETKIREIFLEQFGEDALDRHSAGQNIFDHANNSPVGPGASGLLDSLDKVEFVMAIEDEFDVEIADAEGDGVNSLAEAAALVDLKIAARNAEA